MKLRLLLPLLTAALVGAATLFQAADSQSTRKLLFFTKSATFEHSVISWKDGQPSHAEKVLIELGAANGWEFEFSKDGSKFSPEYLSQFDGVIFYTTGNLQDVGKDGHPAMTAGGEQALYDYVRNGGAFIGT